ncbi:MAG: MATE family efflux transporter [Planctomycetaceae bacterium]|nr:MATE family efflux transporter [Planctomycetaceae bacterium]
MTAIREPDNALARRFTITSLLRFAFPTMMMMLFMSMYTAVDAMFIARFVGTDALSAINIVSPVLGVAWGLGTMFASGGSAIIARKMGERRNREAREIFTAVVIIAAAVGVVLAIVGGIFVDDVVTALGASPRLLPYGRTYFFIIILFAPVILIQVLFLTFFVTAGKPHLGLAVIFAAGCANVVLDYLFIVEFGMGIGGAAVATGIGYSISTVTGLVLFSRRNGPLHFARPRMRLREFVQTCYNGASEMIVEVSISVTTFLYNITLMRLAGEDGVAAISIIIYTQFFLITLLLGFSTGVAPILSYQFGAGNTGELRRLLRMCLAYIAAISVGATAACLAGAPLFTAIFTPPGTEVYRLAVDGFGIYAYSILFTGVPILTSATFTALSNGTVSAILSFLRAFVLLGAFLLTLPRLWGLTGVWLAPVMAEFLALVVALALLFAYRKRYFGVGGTETAGNGSR